MARDSERFVFSNETPGNGPQGRHRFNFAVGTRWIVRRKLEIVAAVKSGELDADEFCRQQSISAEEFSNWWDSYAALKRSRLCRCWAPTQACKSCACISPAQARSARRKLGWTFAQAATSTGVSVRSLTRFEANQFLSPKLLRRLRTGYEAHDVKFEGRVGSSRVTLTNDLLPLADDAPATGG